MAYLSSSAALVISAENGVGANASGAYDSLATGTDRLLMVALMYENGGDPGISAITYNGVGLTKEGTAVVSPTDDFSETIEIWYLANPATGSNTLAMTNSATSHDFMLMAAVYTGRNQSTPILSANNVTIARQLSDDGTTTIDKPSADDEVFWAIVQDRGGDTAWSLETDNNSRLTQNFGAASNGQGMIMADRITGSGASTAVGATQTDTGPEGGQDLVGFFVVMQPASTGVSGDGALQAGTATLSGAGDITKTGSGTLQAGQATASGEGTITKTGSGTLQAGQATASGEGSVGPSGSGTLQASQATASGEGTITKTGSGTLQASQATASGSGVMEREATGALQAGTATMDGEGGVGLVGSGSLQAGQATVSGEATVIKTASGALQADAATLSGAGDIIKTASGALQADAATLSGAGAIVVSGSGALQAGAASTTGAAVTGIVATGALQADTAILQASGIRTITGSGTMTAALAVAYGYNWGEQGDAAGMWVGESDASDTWTEQSSASGNWLP